ncbi:MFS transporter [Nonomuraea sp. SYSU D8015]|uniref:MFS transporter n=1 Tax=Nonomuraea sp. SYSU D8015 TaxID=2593644 RepID=UPI0016617F2A|nr:MFS transporter [Nonomuraea sp. SYSU D8015]
MSVTPQAAPAGSAAAATHAEHIHADHIPADHAQARISRSHRDVGSSVVLVVMCGIANGLVMADIVAATMCISVMPMAGPREAVVPDALARQLGLAGWSWMATGFLICFAALLSVGGHLAARLGPRLVLGSGLVIFAASTAAMMAAPTWLILLAARAGQASGAALMIPASLGLLIAHLPRHRQRAAIGWWSGAGAAGTVLLHAGGGALVASLGWRALFLPGLVLAAASVCLLPALPRDHPGAGRMPDLLGALLLVIGIGALVLVICHGADWGWTSRRVLAVTVLGLTAVAAVLWRSRFHPRPAVPLALWRHGRWRWGWLMSAIYGVTAYPILAFAPSYLADIGFDAWWASLLLCPLSAAVMLAGPLAGAGSGRWGSAAAAYTGAMLVIAAGIALAWLLRTDPDSALALAALAVLGLGLGILSAVTATVGSQTHVPGQAAVASAATMTARQGGGALGVAGASVLLQHPLLSGPSAGYQSILITCLAAAGLCGLLAVARPLMLAWKSRRVPQEIRQRPARVRLAAVPPPAAPPLPPTVPPAPAALSASPVPREVLEQLHTALIQAAQAAETWLQAYPSDPVPIQPSSRAAALPAVATGDIARCCPCHPELDPLAATILHATPAVTARRRRVHQRLQTAAPIAGGHAYGR